MAAQLSGATSRAWAEIDLAALSANLGTIRRQVGAGRRIIAIVKADAYGHGSIRVARRLSAEGVEMLGVATPEEGVQLRRAGIRTPILVVGAIAPERIAEAAAEGLTIVAYSQAFLAALLEEGRRRGGPVPFHLKLDTGMGRLGLMPEELSAALRGLAAAPSRLEGVLTTLSCADDPDDRHTAAQLRLFEDLLAEIRAAGLDPDFIHAANSGGILNNPASWHNAVRPGIILYGVPPSERPCTLDLRPVLSFKTRVMMVKRVPKGTPLGYGRSRVTERPSLIGTLGVGYADGLNRLLSDTGHALVNGRPAPYAGRISMDHAMVDLTGVGEVAPGDEVVLVGGRGGAAITAWDFSRWCGTIPYEILCRVGERVPRVEIETGAASGAL